jgi:AbrB family looped-hinge helix DNA binding protein
LLICESAKILFGEKIFVCHFTTYLSVKLLFVDVDKQGRIILPKRIRQKYGVHEGVRFVVTEFQGGIYLVPVKVYQEPTEVLFAAVRLRKPIEEPKQLAREHIRKELTEDSH